MKIKHSSKKVLSILVFCLMLTALFATWALADTEYNVKVNGIAVTDANKDDVLSDGGKVKYDPDTNTLTATEMLSTALNIKGNGATNIVVTASDAPSVADLTVTDASDVSVINTGNSAPVINGLADITCSGEVEINSAGYIAVCGDLTVNGATDISVTTSASSPAITGEANITCTGNVEITNDKSIAINRNLTVNNAVDVTVSGANAPTIYNSADITCSGNVTISNKNYIAVFGKLTVNDAVDVTVSGKKEPTLCNPASITCSGNVSITNTGSNAVSGTLTVNGAKDVTVTTDSLSPAISDGANITCTGNVTISNENYIAVSGGLTVKGAADVLVSGAKAPTINGNADITCSGTAKIVNEGVYALGNLTFNQADGRAFSVKAGETVDSLATVADVEAGNAYGPAAHSEKVIYVEPVCSTVTFDANGGTASAESAVTEINGKLASLPDATLEGFSFDGWFTEKDGGEEITLDKVFAADTTVYAHWTELPHVHNLTLVPAKEATATEPGNIAYYTCDGCDLWFADENGETEITDKNSVIIPALGEPEEECGCPFFRWLKAFTESCIKWIKEMPVSVSEWFAGVFNNILTILKIN